MKAKSYSIPIYEIGDYVTLQDKLMVQAMPVAGNEELLATIPHTEYGDIAEVYRFVIDKSPDSFKSILVTNQMLDYYGITAWRIHSDALASAPIQFPASIRSMWEVLEEISGTPLGPMPAESAPMFVATCNGGNHGAGCIFYPYFMQEAEKTLGGSFYILPSSVHEIILLKDCYNMTPQELQSIVQEINQTEVAPEDYLSDSIYHYDAITRMFRKIEVRNEN